MEVLISVAAKIAEYAVAPIGRQMGYLFSYAHNLQMLADQLKELDGAKGTIECRVNVERRNGKQIKEVVLKWLGEVDEITEKAKKLCEDPYQEKAGCYKCSFPNLWKRHQLSRKAKKVANNVAHVIGEGKNYERDEIGFLPPISGVGSASAASRFVEFESRMSKVKEIMQALTDPKVSILGVYGLGGVGKSTLVDQIARKAKNEKLFDEVVRASVTRSPDHGRVQEELADQLGLQFTEKSVLGRADRLRQRINTDQNILIILDDIWEAMKLEDIGIPYRGKIYTHNREMESQGDRMGCKVLLISRNQDVLQQMETQMDFRLDPLNGPETWHLFEFMAGDEAKNVSYQGTAIKVAEKCSGLPVLIVTVAKALQRKDIAIWKAALSQLARVDENKELHEIAYSALELSYNQLESNEVKTLFLLCGVEGPRVIVEDLLKYVMGLGVFKNINSLKNARYKLYQLISALKASCLLLEADKDVKFVRMHDIVHEVAISIASRDEYIFIRKGNELKEWPTEDLHERCPQIILRKCCIPKLPQRLHCAELKFLHLDIANNHSLEMPDSFFDGMAKLQVLDLTCMSMSSIPTSLCSLTNLQTLCLRKCSLEDLAGIGTLKNLKILNLSNSSMGELPSEIVKLTNLRMLDMSNSRIAVIPPNIISSLTTLEELYVGGTSIKWEVRNSAKQSENASLAELNHLPNLTALDIQIQDVSMLPRDFMFEKLEKYKILIGGVWGWWHWFDSYEASRTLKLELPTSIHFEHGIKALIKTVESLYMDEINGISNVLYELNAEGFPLLKHLHIQNNAKIQHIINFLEWNQAFDSFPNLETMVLQNLSKLEKLCHGPLTINSLSKLRVIKVQSCGQMKYLFSYSLVKRLSQLINIEVSRCSSMQKVVFMENDSGIVDDGITNTMEFCGLQSLTLQNLPMLNSFCSNELATNISDPFFSTKVAFPNLETLKLTSVNLNKIWDINQLFASCGIQNLTRLIVEECEKLKHLFSYSMIGSLSKLKQLEISKCHMMDEIMDPEEGRNNALASKEVQFSSLEKITIKNMENLRTAWRCQSNGLKSMVIEQCAKLVCVFPSYMQRKFHALETLTVGCCDSVEEIFKLDENEIGCEEDVTKLATLNLWNLRKLKQIWSMDSDRIVNFPNLQAVNVGHCSNLEYLFPLSIATRLQKIEKLDVIGCGNMKEIVAYKRGQMEQIVQFVLNQLTTLILSELHQFRGFYGGNYTLSCPSLKKVHVEGCEKLVSLKTECMSSQERHQNGAPCVSLPQPLFTVEVAFPNLETLKLTSVNLTKIWDIDQFSATCGIENLTCLIVKECGKLKHLFSYSMIGSLSKLKQLEISRCQMMEEIIDPEEGRNNALASKEVQFSSLEKITIKNMENLRTAWHCQSNGFKSIVIEQCVKLVCVFPSYMQRKFHTLETLTVRDCDSVEEIFKLDENEIGCEEDVTKLAMLNLWNLRKLKQIWSMDSDRIVNFPNLQAVDVQGCPNLEYLFPLSIATRLQKIEELNVAFCVKMKEIVAYREGEMERTVQFVLNQLTTLILSELHQFRGFYGGNYTLSCPSLKKVHVEGCEKLVSLKTECVNSQEWHQNGEPCFSLPQPLFTVEVAFPNLEALKLTSVNFNKIWDIDQFFATCGMQNLTCLIVNECGKLKHLFSYSMIGSLSKLKQLGISKCHMMEEIVNPEEGRHNALASKEVQFPNLEKIMVHDMENLRTVLHCQCDGLKSMVIEKCAKLVCIFPSYTQRKFHSLETLTIKNCDSVEVIFKLDASEIGCEEDVTKLANLTLSFLPRLKQIWSLDSDRILNSPNLQAMDIKFCHNLEYLFPLSIATRLHKIEKLRVTV